MKTRAIGFTMILALTGCTTVEFVRRDLTPSKKAILRYSIPSDANSDTKYRAELDKKAKSFCGEKYKIAKEYEAREDSGSTGVGTGVSTGIGIGAGAIMIGGSRPTTTMYHFVEIECE